MTIPSCVKEINSMAIQYGFNLIQFYLIQFEEIYKTNWRNVGIIWQKLIHYYLALISGNK